MDIVIVGASHLGLHVAEQFSKADYNVMLVEHNEDKLEAFANELDIGYRVASGVDFKLLSELAEKKPDLLLAASDRDELNLVICALAKSTGFLRTMARLKSDLYLNTDTIDLRQLFFADHIISPDWLAASEFFRFLTHDGAINVTNFAHGTIQMRKIRIPDLWRKTAIPIKRLSLPEDVVLTLIQRQEQEESRIIFPHGDDHIYPNDEVIVIGRTDKMSEVHSFFSLENRRRESVFIYGLSTVSGHLANLLKQAGINVKIVSDRQDECLAWSRRLSDIPVLYRSKIDKTFLLSQQANQYDVFIAASEDDQDNLTACLMAQDIGCNQTAISLKDIVLADICQRRGISLQVSPYEIAFSHIMSLAAGENISSMVSLYNHSAEVMQMHVSAQSPITGIPLMQLSPQLPKEVIFGVIENRGRIQVAKGSSLLIPGDTVIALCHPRHVDKLKQLM